MTDQAKQAAGSKEAVKQEIDDSVLEAAAEEGIDVASVIEAKLAKHEGYNASTVARFAKSAIQSTIEASRAEEIKGMLMGSRDRYGKNWPRRFSVVRSNGEHVEVSNWSGSAPGPDGNDVKIPAGAAATLWCDYDQEYDSYELKSIDVSAEFGHADLVKNIREVAVTPSELGRDDEYELVVVEGTINWTGAQTLFVDGDPGDDGPVLMEDDRGELQPHVEFVLEQDGQTQLRGHFERQSNGRPFIQVPDLMKLLHDGYQDYDSPEEQARFVGQGINGTRVLMVGNVNSYNIKRSDDGEPIHYVDMGLTAMISVENVEQPTLEESASTDEETESASPEPADPQEASRQPAEASGDGDVSDVRETIEQYAGLVGEDVEDLTFEAVRESVGALEDTPDVVVKKALGVYDEPDEDSEDESESDDDSLPTVGDVREEDDYNQLRSWASDVDGVPGSGLEKEEMREALIDSLSGDGGGSEDGGETTPFDRIEEDGLYHCPGTDEDGDDCIASAGSTGELVAHIFDEHGATGDPAEWISERIEG